MTDYETGPFAIKGYGLLGAKEAEVRPFEPADVDFAAVNEKRLSDPTYGANVVPDALVGSCSQCCMAEINGKPNILGRMHRKIVKSCSQCPVGGAGDFIQARDGDGNLLYVTLPDGTRRPMTQTELLYKEIDGTA